MEGPNISEVSSIQPEHSLLETEPRVSWRRWCCFRRPLRTSFRSQILPRSTILQPSQRQQPPQNGRSSGPLYCHVSPVRIIEYSDQHQPQRLPAFILKDPSSSNGRRILPVRFL